MAQTTVEIDSLLRSLGKQREAQGQPVLDVARMVAKTSRYSAEAAALSFLLKSTNCTVTASAEFTRRKTAQDSAFRA